MPGRLRTSFRSGNLAEHLGLLLIKGVAAVADVDRPEDVGLDAIATLLLRDDDGNCYAEDSFVVQLKSQSANSIDLKAHELEWFVAQSLPVFIGLVSLADSQISLYPTLFVNHAVHSLDARWVTIRFGPSELPAFLHGQKWSPWKGEDNDGATVWLGPPLLRWTLSDLVDRDWATRTYDTLKRFLVLARRERELLLLGQCSVIDWLTNDVTSIASQSGIMKGHPDELASLAVRSAPCLHAIMLRACAMPNGSGHAIMISLLALTAALRDIGVEVDPDNLFGKLSSALLRSQKVEGIDNAE